MFRKILRAKKYSLSSLLSSLRGSQLILAIMVIMVVAALGSAAATSMVTEVRKAKERIASEKLFQIAEAGVEYYRWHLAHVPDDFQDGTGAPGPYIHDFKDASGNTIGQYSLTIIPPSAGSTIVTVESTGYLLDNPNRKRTVRVKFGIPSLSTYAVAANDVMRFGSGTEVFGPIHSNGGVRFDGVAHNIVTSSRQTYDDPDHGGVEEDGVHTHNADINSTFLAGRQFPVPPIDFNGLTADLAQMKIDAQANGLYLTASGGMGYHIHFNTNDTVDIRRVTAEQFCRYRLGGWRDYPNIRSIATEEAFTLNGRSSLGYPLPSNGIIFAEDNMWVDGTIDSARITVVAAREPLATGNASIFINNSIRYTNTDGRDAIGLIAQQDISVGFYSENDLRIDAALIAQRGRVGRFYYQPRSASLQYNPPGCRNYIWRNSITAFGSLVTNQRYGFAYTDSTGYNLRTLNFDTNLTFAPPPSFPTTGQYSTLSWEEK